MMKFLLGVAAALALVAATPAAACEDCKNCPNHKKESAQVEKKSTLAEADKKEEKGCTCHGAAQKECKCGDKCHCMDKKDDKKEEPKKT
jgi:hypothetical protein